MPIEYYDDPVAAYDRLAPFHATYSKKRELYLRSIEREIVARIPSGAQSLLDIGSADGLRSARIAAMAGIARVVLVEPSPAMTDLTMTAAETWHMRAEDLTAGEVSERFDVITCLWNVLGHIRGRERREQILKTAAALLLDQGRLFVDVNHRYNAKAYGWAASCARCLRDVIARDAEAGDVAATWNTAHGSISTYGHVFTHGQIVRLGKAAGLEIEERIVIDYADGSLHRLPWRGNLLYILRRNCRKDSSSAPATS